MKKLIIVVSCVSLLFVACKSSKPSANAAKLDCSKTEVSYEKEIKGIMVQYCTKCHNENEKGGYNLLELEFVKKAAKKGDLLGVIKWSPGYAKMPARAEKLDDATINKIECWINTGMK